MLFIVGLILMIKGGDFFLEGAVWMADITGIPRYIIAATIVSLATTMPEMLVSAMASYQGADHIAIGNAIGSVLCNIGLILALSLLLRPGRAERMLLRRQGFLMLASVIVLMVLTWDGSITRVESIALVFLLVIFLWQNLQAAKTMRQSDSHHTPITFPAASGKLLKFFLGAVGLVIGARLLIDNGTEIARSTGIPESIIALTLIAIGTSLPELVTTITAVIKREPSMSVGNIIGANILDMTLVLVVSTLVGSGGLATETPGIWYDCTFGILLCLAVLIPGLKGKRFYRWQALLIFAIYAAYLVVRV